MILDTDASPTATAQTEVSCVDEDEPATWLPIPLARDGSFQTKRLLVPTLWFTAVIVPSSDWMSGSRADTPADRDPPPGVLPPLWDGSEARSPRWNKRPQPRSYCATRIKGGGGGGFDQEVDRGRWGRDQLTSMHNEASTQVQHATDSPAHMRGSCPL